MKTFGERGDHRVVGGAAGLAGAAALQQVERGQRVGDVAGELELLGARRQRRGGASGAALVRSGTTPSEGSVPCLGRLAPGTGPFARAAGTGVVSS